MAERLKTEEALSHSEQRFRAIFDSVNDAIFVQDLSDGRILDVNQKMCEMYGCTVEEARQLMIEDLSAGAVPYTQQDALAWMQKAASGEPQIFEWRAKDRAGRLFWIEVNMRRAVIDGQDRLLVVVRDVDDRRRAAEALRRERAYYEAIVNATPVMLWLKDTENRTLHLNPAAAAFEGVQAAQVEGQSAFDLYPRDQAEAFYRDDLEVIQSGQPKLGIIEQHTATGTGKTLWVETGKVPVRDELGNLVGVLACAIDITARKAAEEREQRVSQGLRTVIEAAQELINCADLDALYQRSVELAREKLGLERCGLYVLDDHEEFILGTFGTDDRGRTTDERQARHPIEDYPEVFSIADRLWVSYERVFTYWKDGQDQLLEGKGWNAATPIRSRRRTVGVLYNDSGISHAPLDETQQDIVAVYCSLLGGLLELKRTEAELAHERDLLQALMDNFPDTIYFKDTASRFTRINRAQAKLLGVASPEEAVGKTDADFFHSGELGQLFLSEEQRLMTSGEPIIDRLEYNPTPEGRPRWLSASKVPLRDASGHIVGMVGISRDITDRISAEQREKTISNGLRAVIEATQELVDCADVDTLYRRSVELAREKLKVERCGLFVLDEQGWLRGTYGTDFQGKTSVERGAHFPPASVEWLSAASSTLWTISESEHGFWEDDQQQVSGSGWVGTTVIRTRDRVLGALYNDTAITQARVDEAQQEVLAVYCSLVGSLIELKRTEAELAHERDLLQSLMDSIPDTIYFKDTASRFTRVNRQQAALLGAATPEEVVGKTDLDYQNPQLAQMFLAEEQESATHGAAHHRSD